MENKKQPVIRLAIADSQLMVRKAICMLITSFGGFSIDIEACSGEVLVTQLMGAKSLPELCIIDIAMPGGNGYELLRNVRNEWPEMKILVLTAIDHVCAIAVMQRMGANGHILKNSDPTELETALTVMLKDGYYYSKPALQAVHHDTPKITDGELRFLQFCHKDLTYYEIATMMNISIHTIHGYHNSLSRKLKIRTREGLAAFAIKMGFM